MLPILLALLGAAGLAAVLAWAVHRAYHYEPFDVEITHHEVWSPELPPGLDGLTICQVSDLHIAAKVRTATAPGRNAAAISSAIRRVHADLFVLTGDMIYMQPGVGAFFEWFDALGDAIRPVVAVRGNAEHKWFVNQQEVLDGLAARNVPVLNNQAYIFDYHGASLQVVGVDDPHMLFSDFRRAYSGADPDAWTLLLCHSPDGAVEMAGRRADLMLCGHTHAGQIRLPLIGALKHGTDRVRGLVMGWYDADDIRRRARVSAPGARMYVTRGLGMNCFPCRFLCRPELPVFTLRRGCAPGCPESAAGSAPRPA